MYNSEYFVAFFHTFHYDTEGIETALQLTPKVVKGAKLYPVEVGHGEIVILVREKR